MVCWRRSSSCAPLVLDQPLPPDRGRGPGTSRWASEFREPPQRGRSAASSRARRLAGCFPRTSPSSRSQVADLAGLGVSGSASASGRPRMVGQPPGRRRWLPTATRLLAPTPAGGLRATPGCPVVRRLTKRFVMTRLPRLLLVLVFFPFLIKNNSPIVWEPRVAYFFSWLRNLLVAFTLSIQKKF